MTFDVRQVDQNLQAIAAIEAAWDLPGLPDDVKLDLAAIASPPVLAQVLTGLEDDLVEAERRDAAYPTRFDLGFSEPYNPTAYAYTGREQVGRTLAGVFGLEPPQQLSPDAAVRLKSRLAEGGYLNLTPEEVHSDSWLPEYSYAASRFNFDEMTARFQGNEPGSFSVDQIFDWVDQWLSPRGLYRAAVELDLFWDAEAIATDFQTWGDKWRAWSDDKLNVRKLLDALTGPVDDLLFPIINIGLMFTGIGEVIGVGRALHLGFKGADAVSDLYRSSKLIVAGADDIARFAQPSRLSSKIGGMGKAGAFVSDKMMDAWRAKGSVIMAKKVNQQVLRAGFISNVQQWVDADRGGASISHWTGGDLSDRTFQMMSNPALDWGVDLLLYPTNIFNPGTFSRPLRAITKGVQQGLMKAANNQSLLHGFDRAITQTLQEAVERGDELAAEQLARYQDLRRGSIKEAIRDTFFEGNEEQMGAALAYITTSAALDYHARRLADVTVGNPLHTFDTATRRHFHHYRNMLVGQLRPMDPNNLNEVFRHLAKYGDGSGEFHPVMRRGAKHFYRRLREIEDAFLESWEDMRKRGAAVPAGHTRFIGHWDEANEVFSWRPLRGGDPLEGDPFLVDVRDADLFEAMGDEAASVLSGVSELPEEFANRYLRHDADGHLRHHRLSEAGKFRILSKQGAQRLRDVVRRHNELRNAKLDEIMAELDPDVIASYMYQVMPTLGRWNEFVEATHMVDEFANRGDLLNVRLTTPISESGRRLSAMPVATAEAQISWQSQIGELITELADDEKLYNQLMKSVFAPLARHVDPAQGMFTVALKDTVDKAEALQFAASARRLVSLYESLGSLRSKGLWNDVVEIAAELTEETKVTSTVVRELLAHRIAAEALTEKSVEAAAGLIRRARAEKVSLDELEDVLLKKLHALDADEVWSTRYNVQSDLKPKRGADTVQGRVLAKAKELQRLSEFMATTVEGAPKALAPSRERRRLSSTHWTPEATSSSTASTSPSRRTSTGWSPRSVTSRPATSGRRRSVTFSPGRTARRSPL